MSCIDAYLELLISDSPTSYITLSADTLKPYVGWEHQGVEEMLQVAFAHPERIEIERLEVER